MKALRPPSGGSSLAGEPVGYNSSGNVGGINWHNDYIGEKRENAAVRIVLKGLFRLCVQ